MPDDYQLPWNDEQWATVQRTVQDTARKARVAASFLPLVGPLPDGQASVPALPMSQQQLEPYQGAAPERLEVDDGLTLRLTTIACEVYLKTQQAEDPELSAAYQMLGRAADVIGRLEDAIIFNGQPGPNAAPEIDGHPIQPEIYTVRNGQQHDGLVAGVPDEQVKWHAEAGYSENLVGTVVGAVATLEGNGHYGPFACVLGHELYRAANTPSPNSLVLPSDRIVPFLDGGPLRRSSVVPRDLGVIVALAGAPIDLVVASDVHVRFLQLSIEPRYVLRVSERFVLRIKQPQALFVLKAGAHK
jgi:uncharacterized linocin/CFP29 family protein